MVFFNTMKYYTYILYSYTLNKFYTGQTEDLDKRLFEHNRGKIKFMARVKPWKLIYHKPLDTRSETLMFERMIKKRGAGRFLLDNNIS